MGECCPKRQTSVELQLERRRHERCIQTESVGAVMMFDTIGAVSSRFPRPGDQLVVKDSTLHPDLEDPTRALNGTPGGSA